MAIRNGRPRLLDLFCGAGGAAMGYHRAGFDVVGVDIRPQPRYPFEFHQADAMGYPLEGFDAVHASPPCQLYSDLRHFVTGDYRDLVDAVRAWLWHECSVPWVIENVPNAPGPWDILLCGTQFGLASEGRLLIRHRYFVSNIGLQPCWVNCSHHAPSINPYHAEKYLIGDKRRFREAAGLTWMRWSDATEAIPVAYTEFIGQQLLVALEVPAA